MTAKIDIGQLTFFAGIKNVQLKVFTAYHVQLQGKYQVNVYPTTGRIYIQGMNYSARISDHVEAVDYATGDRFPRGIDPAKRKALGKQKWLMWKTRRHECGICGKEIPTFEEATVDHKVPRSRGGSNRMDNLQLAHERCNQAKGNSV